MGGKYATERLRADTAGIARAAQLLREGKLVALPTETVYGLAARADREAAVARIYAEKGRPSFNPLIVHVADMAQAQTLADFPDEAVRLTNAYWPGPLTLVLPRKDKAALADAVTAGLETVALRMPQHPVMRDILRACATPLAAPSANRSGWISPTSAAHVLASLDGRIDAVVDGGECGAGIESTIAAVRAGGGMEVLRPGPIAMGAATSGEAIEAPGQLASHYSPGKPMRLNAAEVAPDDFMIGFGPMDCDCSLSPSGDLTEAAARLYACLHDAANSGKPTIAVAPIPANGIGIAINDRLRRAATPPE